MNNPCPDIEFRAFHAETVELLVIQMNIAFKEGWQVVPNSFFPQNGVVILFKAKK